MSEMEICPLFIKLGNCSVRFLEHEGGPSEEPKKKRIVLSSDICASLDQAFSDLWDPA